MKYTVCAVRDRAADVFGQPIFTTSVGAAVRSFGDEVNRADEKNQLYNHADDFDLYKLGTYDDAAGVFECGTPEQVAVGKNLRR